MCIRDRVSNHVAEHEKHEHESGECDEDFSTDGRTDEIQKGLQKKRRRKRRAMIGYMTQGTNDLERACFLLSILMATLIAGGHSPYASMSGNAVSAVDPPTGLSH